MEIAIDRVKREAKITGWFAAYSKQLLDFVRSKISDFADAEDLAQDVWTQVTKIGDVDEIEEITGWLYTTARNRITDFYRKKKTLRLDEESEEEGQLFSDLALPSEVVESNEFWEIFFSALDELPPEQREAFVEHELNGVSFKELSAKTGVPVNTLLARKRYATLKLRTVFEELNS